MATVHLAGRLTREPELKFRNSANGRTLVLLNLALNHRYQDANGNWSEGEPTFVEVQCWGKLANNVLDCMGKGMSVLVIGRLIQSNWEVELNGEKVKRSVLRVKASHVGPDLNWQRAKAIKDEDFGEFEARGMETARAAEKAEGGSEDNEGRELVGAGVGAQSGNSFGGNEEDNSSKPPF
ncbi:single-stranded DNA-binding protein [Corynebacterium auriscanis]|uniref:single-stranded DNA-binding protein n=1 Tax=Corynebacterium auriscanis TaxID=99807 RepID=UPI003CFA8251